MAFRSRSYCFRWLRLTWQLIRKARKGPKGCWMLSKAKHTPKCPFAFFSTSEKDHFRSGCEQKPEKGWTHTHRKRHQPPTRNVVNGHIFPPPARRTTSRISKHMGDGSCTSTHRWPPTSSGCPVDEMSATPVSGQWSGTFHPVSDKGGWEL